MTPDDLKAQTKELALRVMRLIEALPSSTKGRVIADQVVRSACSVGANYRAVCRARSHKEFVAKLAIVIKEADETAYWLELIAEGELLKQSLLEPSSSRLEIVAIMVAARKTAVRGSQ